MDIGGERIGAVDMEQISRQLFTIGDMDRESHRKTAVHLLDPRMKLIVTICFIIAVVSFGKYEVAALLPFFLFPVMIMAITGIPFLFIARKVLVVLPFVFFVAIFNPIFDTKILFHFYGIPVSGGWLSFVSVILRFVLTVSMALLLLATTGINKVCLALEKLYVPNIFVVQLLFLYRYIFVLMNEGVRMVRAREARVYNNGSGVVVYANMLGTLLIRSIDRAQRVYSAMENRGFDGTVRQLEKLDFKKRDFMIMIILIISFIFLRIYNIPVILGDIITKGIL